MAPPSLLLLLAASVAALLATPTADAFSPPRAAAASSSSSTALSMGIFDSLSKAFSNEEYGDPPEAIKAVARHILVPTEDEANTVLKLVGEGTTTFGALAGEYSTCPSKSRGGSLGSFAPGTMVKEFDDVVFSPETQVGEVMGPIRTQFGYHLIVVDKRSGGSDWY